MERRALLATAPSVTSFYLPSEFPPFPGPSPTPEIAPQNHPIGSSPLQLSTLDTEGKVLTGTDRQGDQWIIQVNGPGEAIVSDISPNDGALDDQLNTITLVGTDPKLTNVEGEVIGSPRLQTAGTITFQHLFSQNGVNSIVLNGFTLIPPPPPTTAPPANSVLNTTNSSIYLPGGVGLLQFHSIDNITNLGTLFSPINIVIGDPNNPLKTEPIIRLDEVINTALSGTTPSANQPQLEPTVTILVNGEIQSLSMISVTGQTVQPAFQSSFPIVGTTGRTQVLATGINNLEVTGAARNFTVSRSTFPFLTGFSGVDHIGSARFGGTADAVGLDVNGPIGRLQFERGLGDPTGTSTAPTALGTPQGISGYPAAGLLGGLVTATQIGSLRVGPADNVILQTPQDPSFIINGVGQPTYYYRPGNALTNALIVSSLSIGNAHIVGNSSQSEIKSGFHYPSFIAGLEGTRAPSQIAPLTYRGDLVNSVISATYRPVDRIYGNPTNIAAPNNTNDVAGPGALRGHFSGSLYYTGAATTLDNTGVGFFARRKYGYFPPPQRPTRLNGVLVR